MYVRRQLGLVVVSTLKRLWLELLKPIAAAAKT
jgi:hypothetical protein